MEACKQIELKMQIQALNRKRKTHIAEKQKKTAEKQKACRKAKNCTENQQTTPKSKK
jgi:hypothetical protein